MNTRLYTYTFLLGASFRLLLFICLFSGAHTYANTKEELNREFAELAHKVYSVESKKIPAELRGIKNIEKLSQKTKQLINQNKDTLAILTLTANLQTIENNIDHTLAADILWYLYNQNAKGLADYIYSYAEDSGDGFAFSQAIYQRGKYHFLRGEWNLAITVLNSIESNSALKDVDIDYMNLMKGICLQNMRWHRKSVKFYDAIEPSSPYYSTALMNKAVAYVRQDWWTDAQIELERAIKHEDKFKNNDLVDRLFLTLGFSQIQFEFYRDARETFRSISLEGKYTNRAVLGIGISAMHQGDFIGALNAFNILIQKGTNESSVHESHLLVPFVFEKLKQPKVASAKYTEAIAYFQHLSSLHGSNISSLDEDYIEAIIQARSAIPKSDEDSILNFNSIDFKSQLSRETLLNLKHINTLTEMTSHTRLKQQLLTLKKAYIKQAIKELDTTYSQQQDIYSSYLSQSRYGLAKLYDKNK